MRDTILYETLEETLSCRKFLLNKKRGAYGEQQNENQIDFYRCLNILYSLKMAYIITLIELYRSA